MSGAQSINWPPENVNLAQEYGLPYLKLSGNYRSVLRLTSSNSEYAFKCVRSSLDNLDFLLEVQQFLSLKGFTNFSRLIPTLTNQYFIPTGQGTYFLMSWINGRESNYTDENDLSLYSFTLGHLHKLTKGFRDNKCTSFTTWTASLQDLVNFTQNTGFLPNRLQKLLQEVIRSGYNALSILQRPQVLASSRQPLVVCHHDLTYRNFLITPDGEGYLIDFDYAIADLAMRDLAQFLTKVLKHNNWNLRLALKLLRVYSNENSLSQGDLGLLLAYLYYPRSLRRLAKRIKVAEDDPYLLGQIIQGLERQLAVLPFLQKLAMLLGYDEIRNTQFTNYFSPPSA